jgi:hypothetical protein
MHRYQSAWRYVCFIMTFTAGLWLAGGSAFAQSSSGGNVYGRALDNTGATLPGVTITIAGIGAPRSTTTDSQGQFRFLNISPGKYTLTGELQGFGSATRAADVALGRNTEVDIRLAPQMKESITVTAATPVIDRRQVTSGANIEQIELKEVPTARDPWVMLQTVPGVLVDRVNVGGNKSGQQSYFVGKGVDRTQTVWNLDGVSSTDMSGSGGAAGFYLDFDSFQEFKVTTGSADPSVATPGVQLNMITKRGTNDFRGSGRYLFTSHQLQSSPSVPAEGVGYKTPLTVVNSIDRINEAGVEAGGPIVRDRVWLWGSYSRNPISTVVAGNSALLQKTDLWNYNGKVNAQLSSSNSGFLGYMYSNKTVAHRSASSSRPVETSYNQTGPGWQWTAEDTHAFSPSLFVTARAGSITNGYHLDPVGGRGTQMYYDAGGIPRGSYWSYDQSMPQRQANVEASKFFSAASLSHELKAGVGYRRTPITSNSATPGDKTYMDYSIGEFVITRDANPNYISSYRNVFAGDTISAGNLTVNVGARYDVQRAENNAGAVGANPAYPNLLPAVNFAGDSRPLEWKSVSPRVGLTYALGTDKRTVARASYARYADQLGAGSVGNNNPFYTIQYLYYYWNDTNKNGKFDAGELGNFDIAKHVDPKNPGSPFSTGRVDYGMHAPKTDEYLLGIDREIGSAFAVGATITHRKRTDLVWTTYEKTRGAGDFYTVADYVAGTPITGKLPNGDSYSVPFYKLAPGVPKPLNTVTMNRPDYYQTYNGLELTATKRMEHNWMLRGSVTLTDWKQHIGPGSQWNPMALLSLPSSSSSFSGCSSCPGTSTLASAGGSNGFINSRWATSLNAVYQLPYQISLGAAFTGREGYIIPYYRRVNSSNGFGNVRILASDFDQFRLPNLYNLDMRVAKTFTVMHGAGAELSADLFNVTNQQTVLWRDNRLYNAAGDLAGGSNNIQELQSPRILRVGIRLTF